VAILSRREMLSGVRLRHAATMRNFLILLWIACLCLQPATAADSAFTQFIASLWPDAQAAGVSRATFEAQTRGLEPDYALPDLILPGRPATGEISLGARYD
jgi:membrane-bound lytic murein transglycosylase B